MTQMKILNLGITPHNTSYNVKKCSEGFPFERVY